MARLRDSSFKIQVGRVDTTLGTVPEAGALVFHKSLIQMFYADGFNWLPLQQEIDSLAAEEVAARLMELVAGVAQPFSMFDSVIYNIGGSYTTNIPAGSVTIAEDGDYQFNVTLELTGNSNNIECNIAIVINGTPETGYDVGLIRRNIAEVVTLSFPKTLSANDVLTFQISTDGNDDVTIKNTSLGIQKIV